MKKLFIFVLVALMMFSLVACSESTEKSDETLKKEILDVTDEAYSGLTSADGSLYFLTSTDGKFAVLVLEGDTERSYVRFIGNATKDENNIITITDKNSGYKFSFTAEKQDDGYALDCGRLGEFTMSPADAGETVDSIFITFEEMKDETEKFMNEFANNPQSSEDAEDTPDDTEDDEE